MTQKMNADFFVPPNEESERPDRPYRVHSRITLLNGMAHVQVPSLSSGCEIVQFLFATWLTSSSALPKSSFGERKAGRNDFLTNSPLANIF